MVPMQYFDSELITRQPWGQFVKATGALCSDGVRRTAYAVGTETADTFFSIPARVSVKGKTVSGYVTVECMSGSSVETDDDPATVKFVAYSYGKNGHLLPGTTYRS